MRGKILFVAGAAAGYVLGARAGRKRYEQIAGAAKKVWESDSIHSARGTVSGYAKAQLGGVADKALEGVKTLVSKALTSQPKTTSYTTVVPTPADVRPSAPTTPAASKTDD